MKKVLLGILINILLPINVLAYSNYIIPGGNTLGIEVQSDGIMIIGFYQINGKYNKGNTTYPYYNKKTGIPIRCIMK